MKNILLILLLFITACLPNKKKTVVIEEYPGGERKLVCVYGLKANDITFTKEVSYYKSGYVKYVGYRSKGKRDSTWVQWYDSTGKIWELHQFKQDKRIGYLCRWYENGKPRSSMHFFYDLRWGRHTEWYENGYKLLEGWWRKDKMYGYWTFWYENGNKEKEGRYCGGDWEKLSIFSGKYPDFVPVKDGLWRYYDTYGKLIRTENWEKGCLTEMMPAKNHL